MHPYAKSSETIAIAQINSSGIPSPDVILVNTLKYVTSGFFFFNSVTIYPNKDIWCYTGYTYEDLSCKEFLSYINVLVDGEFVEELKDISLKFRGSSNQRIIRLH